MKDQDRLLSSLGDDVTREVFETLEYTVAKLSQVVQVLFRSTDERTTREAVRELVMVADWRRQALRIAVRMVERFPPAFRVHLDDDGLIGALERMDSHRDSALDGFCAETCVFVEGPRKGGSTRWVYDFKDKRGWGIRLSLLKAIDDLWCGEGGGGQVKPKETGE